MPVKLNPKAVTFAERLISDGRVVHDERDAWSEDAPSAADENRFLESHDYAAYGNWHLGVNDDHPDDTKAHFSFPIGDFTAVHRCGVISAESRAGQYGHDDIEDALKKLLARIDGS